MERLQEMTNLMSNFNILLARKEMRTGKRYKQSEIAIEMGVSASTVSRWMNGKDLGMMTLSTVQKICTWLECDIGELVSLELKSA